MAESNMLEIIQGLQQAAANGYDGALDDKGEPVKIGLKREEGHPILDKRVNDGFKVKFTPSGICIHYQSDILLRDIYGGGFENEMARMIGEVKKFLQKEYKKITGRNTSLPVGIANLGRGQGWEIFKTFLQADFEPLGLKKL